MLRAVVTMHQLEPLLAPELVTHIGHEFPEVSDAPITLVETSSDEGTAIWPAGYCRVEATPRPPALLARADHIATETNNASTAQRFRLDPLANANYAFWRLKCEQC